MVQQSSGPCQQWEGHLSVHSEHRGQSLVVDRLTPVLIHDDGAEVQEAGVVVGTVDGDGLREVGETGFRDGPFKDA